MSAPVIILPVVLANPALPSVPIASIPNLPEFENDAADHWIFDKGGDANLIGRVAGGTLTPVSTAPTYAANFLSLADGGMTGLKTPFDDSLKMTMCGIFRRRAIGNGINGAPLFSSTTQTDSDGGSVAWDFAGPSVVMQTRQGAAKTVNGTSLIATGQWFFAALSTDGSNQVYYVGNVGSVTDNVPKKVGGRKVAIGNGAINTPGYFQGVSVAEFVIFTGLAKSAADLAGIYARSKVRMARRGLAIY